MKLKSLAFGTLILTIVGIVFISGCAQQNQPKTNAQKSLKIPHAEKWGIYELDRSTEKVNMIYSTPQKISSLKLNNHGTQFAFSQQIKGNGNKYEEIAKLNMDGTSYKQLTNNNYLDTYPVWSPDDKKIAYLSLRDTLDIYIMNANGSDARLLFDSGSHDADIDWVKDKIVFTLKSSIWIMNADGTKPKQVTHPPKAGKWGNANLPFGDYDPRLSKDGTKIVFERLENDISHHGNYNLFVIKSDGTGETRLTNTGYSQGLASWSHAGNEIIYIVAAVGEEGKYDLYMVNSDGTNNSDITPKYFPANFLIHSAIFSLDDKKIYFVGEWWD